MDSKDENKKKSDRAISETIDALRRMERLRPALDEYYWLAKAEKEKARVPRWWSTTHTNKRMDYHLSGGYTLFSGGKLRQPVSVIESLDKHYSTRRAPDLPRVSWKASKSGIRKAAKVGRKR